MQESKDTGIKLFGKNIHFAADGDISTISADDFYKAKCGNGVVVEEEKTEQVGELNKILRFFFGDSKDYPFLEMVKILVGQFYFLLFVFVFYFFLNFAFLHRTCFARTSFFSSIYLFLNFWSF